MYNMPYYIINNILLLCHPAVTAIARLLLCCLYTHAHQYSRNKIYYYIISIYTMYVYNIILCIGGTLQLISKPVYVYVCILYILYSCRCSAAANRCASGRVSPPPKKGYSLIYLY